jgi:hypothetical protein
MSSLCHVLAVPTSRSSRSAETPLRGKVYTGYVEAQTGASTTGDHAVLDVTIKLAAVVTSDLERWLEQVSRLLGDGVMDELAAAIPCTRPDLDGGMSAARLALVAFSYAATGSTSSLGGAKEQDFPSIAGVPPHLQQIYRSLLDGIYGLNPTEVTLQGQLATAADGPDVTALASMTYFEFIDGTVTSFIGYRDPLIIVSGREEVTTAAGILAVA